MRPSSRTLKQTFSGLKCASLALVALLSAAPVSAQATAPAAAPATAPAPTALDKRVNKLESEMRAVQRKVFPGGDKRFFEPEVNTQTAPAAPAGVPATSPVADLTSRVDALERQLQSVTGQVEQNGFRVRQLEEQITKMRGDVEFRLNVLEGKNPADPNAAAQTPAATAETAPTASATAAAVAQPKAKAAPASTAADKAAAPAAKGDPVEAEWKAAYAFVTSKDYVRAEPALQAIIDNYPKHMRAASARFWLGRTYFDQKLYGKAAIEFLESYKRFPKELRGPDSLYWLGQSLMRLSPPSPKKACEAYGELEASYPDKAAAAFKDRLTRARAEAKCN